MDFLKLLTRCKINCISGRVVPHIYNSLANKMCLSACGPDCSRRCAKCSEFFEEMHFYSYWMQPITGVNSGAAKERARGHAPLKLGSQEISWVRRWATYTKLCMVWQPNILNNCYEFSGGYAPRTTHQGLCPGTPLGDFRSPDPMCPHVQILATPMTAKDSMRKQTETYSTIKPVSYTHLTLPTLYSV